MSERKPKIPPWTTRVSKIIAAAKMESKNQKLLIKEKDKTIKTLQEEIATLRQESTVLEQVQNENERLRTSLKHLQHESTAKDNKIEELSEAASETKLYEEMLLEDIKSLSRQLTIQSDDIEFIHTTRSTINGLLLNLSLWASKTLYNESNMMDLPPPDLEEPELLREDYHVEGDLVFPQLTILSNMDTTPVANFDLGDTQLLNSFLSSSPLNTPALSYTLTPEKTNAKRALDSSDSFEANYMEDLRNMTVKRCRTAAKVHEPNKRPEKEIEFIITEDIKEELTNITKIHCIMRGKSQEEIPPPFYLNASKLTKRKIDSWTIFKSMNYLIKTSANDEELLKLYKPTETVARSGSKEKVALPVAEYQKLIDTAMQAWACDYGNDLNLKAKTLKDVKCAISRRLNSTGRPSGGERAYGSENEKTSKLRF